jgi:hypothetical protein
MPSVFLVSDTSLAETLLRLISSPGHPHLLAPPPVPLYSPISLQPLHDRTTCAAMEDLPRAALWLTSCPHQGVSPLHLPMDAIRAAVVRVPNGQPPRIEWHAWPRTAEGWSRKVGHASIDARAKRTCKPHHVTCKSKRCDPDAAMVFSCSKGQV